MKLFLSFWIRGQLVGVRLFQMFQGLLTTTVPTETLEAICASSSMPMLVEEPVGSGGHGSFPRPPNWVNGYEPSNSSWTKETHINHLIFGEGGGGEFFISPWNITESLLVVLSSQWLMFCFAPLNYRSCNSPVSRMADFSTGPAQPRNPKVPRIRSSTTAQCSFPRWWFHVFFQLYLGK